MDWNSKRIRSVLEVALLEDKAVSDITTSLTVPAGTRAVGTVVAMEPCTLSGLGCIPVVLDLFSRLQPDAGSRYEVIHHPEVFDGVRVRRGQPLAVIRHTAAAILSTERVILNLLGRMSGIATLTATYVQSIAGTGAEVLDTRKTTPGLRALDRYAVCCGGGRNHRHDLADGILIKSNHIAAAGGLVPALHHAVAARQSGQHIQVEVRTLPDLDTALQYGADSIFLDNMTPDTVRQAVQRIRATHPSMCIEAGGGLNLTNARAFAEAGVNFITVGSLTHSVHTPEINLRLSPA